MVCVPGDSLDISRFGLSIKDILKLPDGYYVPLLAYPLRYAETNSSGVNKIDNLIKRFR